MTWTAVASEDDTWTAISQTGSYVEDFYMRPIYVLGEIWDVSDDASTTWTDV